MSNHTINCNQELIAFDAPKVMGIINATPDSFYDGGSNNTVKSALHTASQMLDQGATFLDVGGYSSRPGASDISPSEEIDRVVAIIKAIVNNHPNAKISVDTFRSEVAMAACKAGACMVNDITAGLGDTKMLATVASLQVPYIMMHMRGTPQTMKSLTHYENPLVEIRQYFSQRIAVAREAGINDVLIDPGFGFAKTTAQNFEILDKLSSFSMFEAPILVGLSRKSMIYKTLNTTPQNALNGTTALNAIALQSGAHILRVHDVAAAVEVSKLVYALKN
ncbi:MAG: dihydropteroate synthase [Gilvibacter sp.]